jgi:hypothetical protein
MTRTFSQKDVASKVILTAKHTEETQRNTKLIVSKSDFANSVKNSVNFAVNFFFTLKQPPCFVLFKRNVD